MRYNPGSAFGWLLDCKHLAGLLANPHGAYRMGKLASSLLKPACLYCFLINTKSTTPSYPTCISPNYKEENVKREEKGAF